MIRRLWTIRNLATLARWAVSVAILYGASALGVSGLGYWALLVALVLVGFAVQRDVDTWLAEREARNRDDSLR